MILGIGLDLAEVSRFELDDKAFAWFAKRIFTDEELAYAKRKRFAPQHLAGCFAAKEALRKALGQAIPWRAAGVIHTLSGAPALAFDSETQLMLDERGIRRIHVTITHTRDSAAAVVILEA